MCWAESLKPIGMPPVASRTSSAKSRKSEVCVQVGEARRADRVLARIEAAHLGDFALDLVPG